MTHPADLAADVLERVASTSPRAEVEVSVARERPALTRFANSVIHQNVAEDVVVVGVRCHVDGRTASATSTVLGEDGRRALVARVLEAAAVAPLDPGWPGVAPPAPIAGAAPVDIPTRDATAEDRATIVADFVAAAGGLEAAGYCRTTSWHGAFSNSAGHVAASERAEVALAGIARDDGADGVARSVSSRLADIDGTILGRRAAAKAVAGAGAIELPPGRYEVVLEPTAVADVLENLAMHGFNAKAVAERRSFVRVGDAQFDPSVSLADDPLAAGVAYDADGTPSRRVALVDAGTTVGITHDRRTAAAAGPRAASTGHGVGSAAFGAAARHLVLAAGAAGGDAVDRPGDAAAGEVDGPVVDAAAAELVAAVERGVLVTDLWYTRVLDPRALVLTGLTRNGVWLIERGEIARPLRNFRFTQAYPQALMAGNVLGVGRTTSALPGDTYSASMPWWTAPALRLRAWNFTGGASG